MAGSERSSPALRHDSRNGALTPKMVTSVSAASRHSVPRSGQPGLPSNSTIVAPTHRPETRRFHIIQPVVENQKKRSPGPMSWWRPSALRCSTRMPPWACTIALGGPVVPEENST